MRRVPFCRRTTRERYHEWICGRHWPTVDRRFRRRLSRLRRIAIRARDRLHDRATFDRALALFDVTWERCKRQAIERAAGITA
jgi:hypothetical protein